VLATAKGQSILSLKVNLNWEVARSSRAHRD